MNPTNLTFDPELFDNPEDDIADILRDIFSVADFDRRSEAFPPRRYDP